MFDKSRQFFAAEEDSGLSNEVEELRSVVVAILVAAAHADSEFDEREYGTIARIATAKLGLDQDKVKNLLCSGTLNEVIPQTLAEIRDTLNVAQRIELLSYVWKVLGADLKGENSEASFANTLSTNLGLTIEQSVLARKKAEGIVIDGFKEFVEASPEVIASVISCKDESS